MPLDTRDDGLGATGLAERWNGTSGGPNHESDGGVGRTQ